MQPTAPFIIVTTGSDCAFYRSLGRAAAAWVEDAEAFDAHGRRLTMCCGELTVTAVEPRELARVLRRWLRYADRHHRYTDAWPLWLLVHAALERAGYS